MKKWLCIAVAVLFGLCARAQEGIPLLDQAAGKRVSFHYTYSLSQKGADFREVTDGAVVVEGNAYTMEGLGLKVVSDGTTRWTMDEEARELVVETVEKEDLYTNPALFIATYRKYMDKIRVTSQGRDSLDVTLELDADTRARFVLREVHFQEAQGKSDFSIDEKSLCSSYLITDLR